jgi:PKD repeat protein
MKSRYMLPCAVLAAVVLSACGREGTSPSAPTALDDLAAPTAQGGPATPKGHAATKANVPPTASIHVTSKTVLVGVKTVEFTAKAQDPDGGPMTYAWDFGDGTKATGATAKKIYAKAGSFTVVLTVRDSQGSSTTATVDMVAKAVNGVWKDKDQQYGIQVQQKGKTIKGRTVFPVRDLTGALKGIVAADRRVTWRTDYFGGAIRDYFDGTLSPDLDTLTGTLGLSDGQITFNYRVKLVRQPKAP